MRLSRAAWSGAVSIALTGTAAASLAALLAPLGWPFELFAHFRWQLVVAALALLLASLVLRRPWMMVVACTTVLLQWLPAALLSGRASAHEPPASKCDDDPLRVVTANAWFANADHAALVAWLSRSDADIIALQEITPQWALALETLARTYPFSKVIPREDPYGIALLSRWPIDAVQSMDFAGDGLPALVANLDVHGRKLQVIALHTRWPVLPGLQVARDRALQQAAALALAQPEATILLGDLNLTPYAPAFARLVAESGLRDAFAGEAWRPTWQAGFWPLALPIDHVLVPRRGCVTGYEIGPDVGSDHRPLQVTLRLP
ncbi:MAG: endonuclease/exonuclease/phosphatase family protein [Steroidobacteraceae bacterium]|jgi:endonuclease/exonuclease/phosphatase (EEP) superfamily protein YafD|nr:endonuclease/exonuclease/phosphatase family protein [Steroidobacteraceae bacterium]